MCPCSIDGMEQIGVLLVINGDVMCPGVRLFSGFSGVGQGETVRAGGGVVSRRSISVVPPGCADDFSLVRRFAFELLRQSREFFMHPCAGLFPLHALKRVRNFAELVGGEEPCSRGKQYAVFLVDVLPQ